MIQPTFTPLVERPAAASDGMEDGQRGRSSAGSADAAAVHAARLEAERNPSLAQLIAERDPRADDAQFYTGLGYMLARSIQAEIDREILRREYNRAERRRR